MEIVMLGHSAAGKTTYVSLMYSVMHAGIGGFSVRASKAKDATRLDRAAQAIRTGRYPAASDQRAVFDLILQHNARDVFPFTWRDYRGGALKEKTDSPQARQLHDDLKRADGIVVFCDSVELLKGSRAARDVRTLVSHVHRAIDARGKRLTPLVLALTKADLVDLEDEKVVEQLEAPFIPLIQAVNATDHVLGTAIPVACGPAPVHVHIPVLWALRFGIIGRARELEASIEAKIDGANRWDAQDTVWNRIGAWAKDETPAWKHAAELRRQAYAEYQIYEPLIEPANQLGGLLDGVPTF